MARTYSKLPAVTPLVVCALIMVALVGTYVLSASNALVATNTKKGLRGLMDSNGTPIAAMDPAVKDYVVNVYWNQVQPNGPTEFNTASVDKQLATASATGGQVRLRVFAGRFSPDWVKREVGTVPWVEAEDVKVGSYDLPLFWQPAFTSRYNNFMNRLAQKYDDDARIAEVTLSKCMTTYAEPMIRQISNATNVSNALAAGYTYDADVACLRQNIDYAATAWKRTRLSIALNPFQGFDRPSGQTPMTVTLEMMRYCRQVLEWRCVLGNNSLRSTSLGSNYDQLYAAMKAAGGPMYFQTATPQKIGDYKATLQKAVDLGAWSIELNASYGTYDKVYLDQINSQLQQAR